MSYDFFKFYFAIKPRTTEQIAEVIKSDNFNEFVINNPKANLRELSDFAYNLDYEVDIKLKDK